MITHDHLLATSLQIINLHRLKVVYAGAGLHTEQGDVHTPLLTDCILMLPLFHIQAQAGDHITKAFTTSAYVGPDY